MDPGEEAIGEGKAEIGASGSRHPGAEEVLGGQSVPPEEVQLRFFDFTIEKIGAADKLGMDVGHINGKLEVLILHTDGAVARSNLNNSLRTLDAETLQPGDTIHSVNGLSTDAEMVAECQKGQVLRLKCSRPVFDPEVGDLKREVSAISKTSRPVHGGVRTVSGNTNA